MIGLGIFQKLQIVHMASQSICRYARGCGKGRQGPEQGAQEKSLGAIIAVPMRLHFIL